MAKLCQRCETFVLIESVCRVSARGVSKQVKQSVNKNIHFPRRHKIINKIDLVTENDLRESLPCLELLQNILSKMDLSWSNETVTESSVTHDVSLISAGPFT